MKPALVAGFRGTWLPCKGKPRPIVNHRVKLFRLALNRLKTFASPFQSVLVLFSSYIWPLVRPLISINYKSKTKDAAIYLRMACYDGRLKYYTGEVGRPGALTRPVAARISQIVSTAERSIADHKIAGKRLTTARLKEILDETFKPTRVKAARPGSFARMDEALAAMQDGRLLTPAKGRYSKGTIKGIRHTRNLLQRFDPRFDLDTCDLKSYDRFIAWCQEAGYSVNYIGGQIKNLKTLGRVASQNPVFADPRFKIQKEEALEIYLTEPEIERMAALELREWEAVARDWFVIDCYTGLRVSDLTRLSDVNLDNGFLTISNEKTDAVVRIPVHSKVSEIIKRRSGFPPKISDQALNRLIKEVARKAKITGQVLHTITKGGVRQDRYLKKWELVSNHTARRSFVTNMRKAGVPDAIVMRLAGIKSTVTLQKYDKLGAREAAEIAAGLSFFK